MIPQYERPDREKWASECGAPAVSSRWISHQQIECPRISGYSTSESDFTPHYNTATGRFVRSLAEMKSLQARHGLEDAVVTGKGERYIPRDWLSNPKHETGRGVSGEMTDVGGDD